MAFLNNLKEKAVDLGRTTKEKAADLGRATVAKSKQLAEITKLATDNVAEEDLIKKMYLQIGKRYYAEHGTAPEASLAELCEKITTAKNNIAENKARIAELKAAGKIDDSEMPETETAEADEDDVSSEDFADVTEE